MKHSKFIIEDGNLILSKCNYHNEIASFKDDVRGGGWFRFKDETFIFYGSSHEFGTASLDDIKDAIENDKVFTNPSCRYSIAKKYKFAYDTQTEILKLNDHS